MKKIIILILCAIGLAGTLPAATSYYVTQSGSATPLSTNPASPSSVATYNSSTLPGADDTVFFSGGLTSIPTANTGGTSVSHRLTLDFTGVTSWNSANAKYINTNNHDYIKLYGGGSWSAGVFTTVAATFPAFSAVCISAGGTDFSGGATGLTIDGFAYLGSTSDGSIFIANGPFVSLEVRNCKIDNGHVIVVDRNLNHDWLIKNNYCATPRLNLTDQYDIVYVGDGYNITIEGNKFIQRTPGATSTRHNDILQCYKGGSGNGANPYGWIVRYNWFELDVASGSGDTSFHQLEDMADTGGVKALKEYGNVFRGVPGTVSNNGTTTSVWHGGTHYLYNNTWITPGGAPGNATRDLINGADILYARNNAGYDPSAPNGNYITWTFSAGATWNYNWFYNWSASSTYKGPNGGSTDPLWTNYAAGDFSTQSGSPLRNAGDSSIGAEYQWGPAPGATWPDPVLYQRDATHWDIGAGQATNNTGGSDITAPTPNPATIASTAHTSSTVTIVATTATDETALNAAPYRFSSDNGSTWTAYQSSATYIFTGLTASTAYLCKVQARDAAGNATTASSASTVTTDATTGGGGGPPSPYSARGLNGKTSRGNNRGHR